jgi:eukaryotic-like serine/threonine-protein kinase
VKQAGDVSCAGRSGSTLGSRYRLGRLLGRGGMAQVYQGTDGVLGRQVAVKVFNAGTDIATCLARQQLEIRALARLQHPNIVAVFDAGTDAGVSFVVMQLIDGVTLAERTRGSALAPAETARVGRAIADALAHVHSLGMVHRDIKPGNILCGADGTVFLTDFGIVRLIGRTRLTQHGTIGTVSYLAPEQVRGEDVGTAADIYALGLVLLECLTGAPEYPGSSAESAVARLSRPPRVPPTVPQSWGDLLTGMTAADPAARPSAREVARILDELPTTPLARAVVADESPTRVRTKPMTVAPMMPPREPAPVRSSRRRGTAWLTAAGVLAAVLIVAVFVWLLPRGGSEFGLGQPPPNASAGPDRLPQDLQDLQSAVRP